MESPLQNGGSAVMGGSLAGAGGTGTLRRGSSRRRQLLLTSFPWYHGPITRIAAELSVSAEGDFLVRDCISSPGDFVLTCRWAGQVLHFRLNRVQQQDQSTSSSASSRILYQFEGECFESVAELIAHHVSLARTISALSGAIIRNPVPRDGWNGKQQQGCCLVLDPKQMATAGKNMATAAEEEVGRQQYACLGGGGAALSSAFENGCDSGTPADAHHHPRVGNEKIGETALARGGPRGGSAAGEAEAQSFVSAATAQNTYFFGLDPTRSEPSSDGQSKPSLPADQGGPKAGVGASRPPSFSSFKPFQHQWEGPSEAANSRLASSSRHSQSMIMDAASFLPVGVAAPAGPSPFSNCDSARATGDGTEVSSCHSLQRRQHQHHPHQSHSLPRPKPSSSDPPRGGEEGRKEEVKRQEERDSSATKTEKGDRDPSSTSLKRSPPSGPSASSSSSSSLPLNPPPLPSSARPRPLPPPPVPSVEHRAKKSSSSPPPPLSKSSAKIKEPFPQDIELPQSTLPPPPVKNEVPPELKAAAMAKAANRNVATSSPTYDVPVAGKARSCLSEKQIECSNLYDQPRILSKFRPFRGVPPPPPSRLGSLGGNGGSSKANGGNEVKIIRIGPSFAASSAPGSGGPIPAATAADCGKDADCLSDVSNTDTSFLEHRELTPLLSSDNDSMVFDTSSLPGDPFPAGLPHHNPTSHAVNNNCNTLVPKGSKRVQQPQHQQRLQLNGNPVDQENNSQTSSTTTTTTTTTSSSQTSDSSPPTDTAAAAQKNILTPTPNEKVSEAAGEVERGGGGGGGLPHISLVDERGRREERKGDPTSAIHLAKTNEGEGEEDEREGAVQQGRGEESEESLVNSIGEAHLAEPRSLFDLDRFEDAPSSFYKACEVGRASSKPLDPSAMALVHRLLLDTDPRTLALHLTLLDVELLSIRLDKGRYPGLPEIRSGLHLLTLVAGRHLRQDLMERFLCLRLFVLVTVFTASNFGQSVRTLARWVEVASASAASDLGNRLALHAIVSALNCADLKALSGLWSALARDHPEADEELRERLAPMLESLNGLSFTHHHHHPTEKEDVVEGEGEKKQQNEGGEGKAREGGDESGKGGEEARPPEEQQEEKVGEEGAGGGWSSSGPLVTVPHLIPFLCGCKDLEERQTFKGVFREVFPDEEDGEDETPHQLFSAHLREMQAVLMSAESYRDAAATALSGLEEDARLTEMLRAEFHLRLLWGGRGSRAPSEERHAKFAKVIRALASICRNIERMALVERGGGEADM